MKSKGFIVFVSIAIVALIVGLFVANYPALKSGASDIKNDVTTQIEQVLPNEDENEAISPNPDNEQEVVEGEENTAE